MKNKNLTLNVQLERVNKRGNCVLSLLTIPEHDITWYCLENAAYLLPLGIYYISLTFSPKFSRSLPYSDFLHGKVPIIYNSKLPSSRGIRIHCGNSVADTRGCLLIGHQARCYEDSIRVCNSADAYREFMSIMQYEYPRNIGLVIKNLPSF